MRTFFILFFIFTANAHAALKHLGVKTLSLEYAAPLGAGTLDKLEIGLSKTTSHAVDVERIGETFVVKTPMLDFTWIEPWKFLLNAEKASLVGLDLSAGKGKHDLTVKEARFSLKGDYVLKNAKVHCEGTSVQKELEDQVMEDCRTHLRASAGRFEVPLDLTIFKILSEFRAEEEEEDAPLRNFTLTSDEGKFYLYFRTRVVVSAGLRVWGNVEFEDDMKTLVIRVNQIKFGVLPVTNVVMRELQARIKDPRVEVRPPFIRFRMKE